MPRGKHQLKVDIPIEQVWSFVSDMNKWAPLVPGYMEHDILNDKQSTWKFKGDLGFVQKTVNLKIDITQWQKPTKVTFNLTGLDDNFKGDGYFEATSVHEKLTKVTGFLNITAKGLKGPMINTVLKSFVPKTTQQLTEAIAEKMNQMETVTN
ncbi:carbon monoxide dehydrogenase subunit G [Virgibacillus halotolerans]|uniref:CoxG family protein n=1 Tax=Virgibacillus halotolerans TaxID=1071053 RepID=UPI0019612717|nr:SRPBCC family protein [Virgibacillus halotolerans]MBM7599364.1 carbon monoxide dehydrogenase subunit G [Virgibacillus halotolerans]